MGKRVIRLVLDNSSRMGRGVIRGVLTYGQRMNDWSFRPRTLNRAQHSAADLGPGDADAILGVIAPAIAAEWDGPNRRFAVNVSTNQHVDGGVNVSCDEQAVARMAADHLRGKGLTDFAFFGGDASHPRCRGFMSAILEAGHAVGLIDSRQDNQAVLADLERMIRGAA